MNNNQLPKEFSKAPSYFKYFWANHFCHLVHDVRMTRKLVIALIAISISVPIATTLGILNIFLR